jgi:alpha-tubulin suppressor-like RCC1 family protein
MTFLVDGNNVVNNDRTFVLGDGDPTPTVGMMRFNNALQEFQVYNGAEWIIFSGNVDKADMLAWGYGGFGVLGDNTTVSKSFPVSVVGGFTDWVHSSAGDFHSLGLRANGTLWSWGDNFQGRLGDNTTVARSSPVSVVGGFTDWVQASGGGAHNLAVRANGTLWAWGSNGQFRLGDSTSTNRSSPVSVVGGFIDWVQASAGNSHSLGLRANGTIWAWGAGADGRLGDNTDVTKSSPVSVVGGFTDWIQASAGVGHSLGLRANGTIWAWGLNSQGRLGDNTITNKSSPVLVVGGFTDWVQVSNGGAHSLGVRANGTLWSWGYNVNGQLGQNTSVNTSSPASVVGGFTDWVQASSSSGFHSLGLRANGTLWSWGNNVNGRLGDNTTVSRSSPVSVVGGFTDWVQASAGSSRSLGVRI